MKSTLLPFALIFILFGCTSKEDHPEPANGHIDDDHTHATDGGASAVNFPVSCDEAVQEDFNRAVAAMHNMTYNVAHGQFEAIVERDPSVEWRTGGSG